MQEKEHIKDLTPQELREKIETLGEKPFRGDQIFREIYARRNFNFEEMTSLPKDFRNSLNEHLRMDSLHLINKQHSSDGSIKFLFGLDDGNSIEAVLIPEKNETGRMTLCISSQSGCAFGCKFCATGQIGFKKHLSPGEIVDQVLLAERISGEEIDNIVFMGMGEPLHNYKNVVKAVRIMTDKLAPVINPKGITVSTVGVASKIMRLAEEELGVKLAVSLHATTNGLRQNLMPIAKKWDLTELGDAIEYFYRSTRIPITYEYIVFDNLNDSYEDAKRLAKFSRRVPSKVNLIPFNDISSVAPEGVLKELKPAQPDRIRTFAGYLRDMKVPVFVRYSAGADIDAACGQLALSQRNKSDANEVIMLYD